jgi:hypothetical protein
MQVFSLRWQQSLYLEYWEPELFASIDSSGYEIHGILGTFCIVELDCQDSRVELCVTSAYNRRTDCVSAFASNSSCQVACVTEAPDKVSVDPQYCDRTEI